MYTKQCIKLRHHLFYIQVIDQQSVNEIDPNVKDVVEGLLVKHGLTDIPLTDINKEKALQDLLVAEVLVTRTAALDSFFRGLNALGLGNLLRKYPIFQEVVLPSLEQATIDIDYLKSRLNEAMKKHVAERENISSDQVAAEEKTWEYLMRFLDEASNLTGNIMLSFYAMKLSGPELSIHACLETKITKITTFMHNY